MQLPDSFRVGYVVKRYPRYSETFIVNEILAHEKSGLDMDNKKQERLLVLLAVQLNILATMGFRSIIENYMLEKIPGQLRLKKLQVINIYEDMNMLLGILFRKLSAHSEAIGAFRDKLLCGKNDTA